MPFSWRWNGGTISPKLGILGNVGQFQTVRVGPSTPERGASILVSTREAVISVLPEASLELLGEIEDFAKLDITFELRETPVSSKIPNPDASSAVVSHDGATVSALKDAITPSGITHELLHIYRYWVEAVPQVMPIEGADTMNWRTTSSIENALEHLVIVPREETYGVYDEEFWNKISRTFWDKYPWPGNDYPWSRRKDCLLGWLSCMEIVTDEAVRDLAKECIDKEGYLTEAIKFHEKIMRVLLDKPRALSTVMRFLPIPFTEVLLVTFDIRKRKRICEKLPSY